MNLLRQFKLRIISFLLHFANRHTKDKSFYQVKDRILQMYGNPIGFDVQFIEGKECWTCNGTGIYHGYHREFGAYKATCLKCYNGWYMAPVWNILQVYSFGKYTFHRPIKRSRVEPLDIPGQRINGYIHHSRVKYGDLAVFIFCLLFEKGYLKRYYRQSSLWHQKWWRIENWLSSFTHLIKYRWHAIPFRKLRAEISLKFRKQEVNALSYDELPF